MDVLQKKKQISKVDVDTKLEHAKLDVVSSVLNFKFQILF